jgi:hypothetical protein
LGTVGRVQLPRVGVLERARLWLSYQRYAFVLVAAPVAGVALAATYARWWVAALVGLVGLVPARFGIEVFARWPRKLRATRIAIARVEAGTFTPASIKGYCGDPCFRVVADEVLARADMPRRDRKLCIRRFSDELRRERSLVVVIDHVRGTATVLGGDARERT